MRTSVVGLLAARAVGTVAPSDRTTKDKAPRRTARSAWSSRSPVRGGATMQSRPHPGWVRQSMPSGQRAGDDQAMLTQTDMTSPDSVGNDLRDVGAALQYVLVDLIDLSLLGKHAHWNVEGPR